MESVHGLPGMKHPPCQPATPIHLLADDVVVAALRYRRLKWLAGAQAFDLTEPLPEGADEIA